MSTNQTVKTLSQETRPVTLRISAELHRTVKIEAINRRVSAQDIWVAAVRRYLKLNA